MDERRMVYINREIEEGIIRFINDPEVIAISGPRQSGKTTLLNHIKAELTERHGPNVVHYISRET